MHALSFCAVGRAWLPSVGVAASFGSVPLDEHWGTTGSTVFLRDHVPTAHAFPESSNSSFSSSACSGQFSSYTQSLNDEHSVRGAQLSPWHPLARVSGARSFTRPLDASGKRQVSGFAHSNALPRALWEHAWSPVSRGASSVLGGFQGRAGSPPALLQQHRRVWDDSPSKIELQKRGSFYDSTVEKYAAKQTNRLSLKTMLETGQGVYDNSDQLLANAQAVHQGLLVRLARRLLDLQLLPYIVVTNPHIKRVYDAYHHALMTLHELDSPTTLQENAEFSLLLQRLVDEHAPMLDSLASGLKELLSKPLVGQALDMDRFLDNMLHSRISRRMLAEHHIKLQAATPGQVGIITTHLSVREACDFAAQRTAQVCMETYGRAPEVIVTGDMCASIPYIADHADYALFELLKNAMRATVEASTSPTDMLPRVELRINESPDAVTIRLSDKGGGIRHEDLERVFRYGYTTTADAIASRSPGGALVPPHTHTHTQEGLGTAFCKNNAHQYRMAGLGFGLPLSRLYARYFGGDLKLVSMPGYGVDAYLTLPRLEKLDWAETFDSSILSVG